MAASVCALMFGYFAELNTRRCTKPGRTQRDDGGDGAVAGGGGGLPPLPVEHGHGKRSQ
jgi:hypothetical protein